MSDIHFTDIDAQVIYDTVIDSLEDGVQENLYPGDERLIFGEALSAVLVSLYNTMDDVARQKALKYARGEVLDALGERLSTSRIEPAKATTTMKFYSKKAVKNDIFIPAGTRVTPDSNCYFETMADAIIYATKETDVVSEDGEVSAVIEAQSVEGGSIYNNYAEGEISILVDLIPFISGVVNTRASSGGDDGESDDSYRERIRLAPASLSAAGTEEVYRYYALSADSSIKSVKIVTDIPGEIIIYPLLKDVDIGDSKYDEVVNKIKDIVNDPKIKAMTDEISVKSPDPIYYKIKITCMNVKTSEKGLLEDIIYGSEGIAYQYADWQAGELGRDINPDKLINMILSAAWENGINENLQVKINIEIPDYSIETSEIYKITDDKLAVWDKLNKEIIYS